MNRTMIELKDVSKRFVIPHEKVFTLKSAVLNLWKNRNYETFYALNEISFSIRESEFLGVIGSNGSGKSTLLKIIAGIYTPDSGSVSVNAKISPFLELGVGFNGELTGRENVYLYGAVLGFSKRQIDAKYNEIVSFAGLEKFMALKMKNYSSGMFSRLAFSVAIQADAPILLIDEVLAVGDADFHKKCYKVFDDFKKDGKTVVMVSHDIKAVSSYCDRALLIDGGRILDYGDVYSVTDKYLKGHAVKDVESSPKDPIAKPFPNGKMSIVRVDFFDASGNRRDSFDSSEEIIINIAYRAASPVSGPVFGMLIRDDNGSTVFGTNTHTRGIKTGIFPEKGVVSARMKRAPILQGRLLFSFAFVSKDLKETYSWSDGPYSIDIKNTSGDIGKAPCDVEFGF